MSHYSVKAFFEVHPKLTEVFETYDGVIHVNREIAESWISRHANKSIVSHENPLLKKAATGDGTTAKTGKSGTGKGANGKGKSSQTKGVTGGETNPQGAQLTIPEGGERPNPEVEDNGSQEQAEGGEPE